MCRRAFWIASIFWGMVIMAQAVTCSAAPTENPLQQAQEAFEAQQNGQTQKAIQSYEQVLEEGHYSPELYNNLGLAYAKQKQLGKAILQWERALRCDAQYKEAQHNLEVAQQQISRPISSTPPIALVKGWQELHSSLSAQNWGFLFLLFWIGSLTTGAYAWKKDKATWRSQQGSKIALGLLLLSFLPIGLGLAQQAQEQEKGIAIVVAQQAGLRPYPELSSEEMEVLSEGVRLKILEKDGEWVKVELPNYLVGWVPKSLLERV